MAATDRYKHESNNKGDTSMSQQANAAKSGSGPTVTPPDPTAGPEPGEDATFGRHIRELQDMHKVHEKEANDMWKRHSTMRADLYKRHESEISKKNEPSRVSHGHSSMDDKGNVKEAAK